MATKTFPRRSLHTNTAFLVVFMTVASVTAGEFSLYYIGNSLTGDLMSGLRYSASSYENSLGNTYKWGTHFRASTSLTYMYNNPNDASSASVTGTNTDYLWDATFVPWTASLPGKHWDAVTLQPWQDSTLATMAGDTAAINGMIAATRTRPDNASTHFYMYAAWPVVDAVNSPFSNAFLTPTPNLPTQPDTQTRDYYRNLLAAVRQTNPGVDMIPAGEVFLALDVKMRNGEIPGFTSIKDIHRDAIHLNSFGSNIVAYTAYATIFKQSPLGLADPLRDVPGDPYYNSNYAVTTPTYSAANPSPASLAIIQQTVWDVVNQQSAYTSVPEPSGVWLLGLGLGGLALLHHRRRA